MATTKVVVASALGLFALAIAGGCDAGMPADPAVSTAYRERLVAPIESTGSPAQWRQEMALRADRGLTDEDVLWLIAELYAGRGTSRGGSAAVALSLSRSGAAASALLLAAHTYDSDRFEREICYACVGAIEDPKVVELLAVDYEIYGYRWAWAMALAQRWGALLPQPSRRDPTRDDVYKWWLREGKARFFKAYPELAKLNYPDGPFVMVPDNRPRHEAPPLSPSVP